MDAKYYYTQEHMKDRSAVEEFSRSLHSPNRGRIRRALATIGGAVLGCLFLYLMVWVFAVACVVAGGSPQVCGL